MVGHVTYVGRCIKIPGLAQYNLQGGGLDGICYAELIKFFTVRADINAEIIFYSQPNFNMYSPGNHQTVQLTTKSGGTSNAYLNFYLQPVKARSY